MTFFAVTFMPLFIFGVLRYIKLLNKGLLQIFLFFKIMSVFQFIANIKKIICHFEAALLDIYDIINYDVTQLIIFFSSNPYLSQKNVLRNGTYETILFHWRNRKMFSPNFAHLSKFLQKKQIYLNFNVMDFCKEN